MPDPWQPHTSVVACGAGRVSQQDLENTGIGPGLLTRTWCRARWLCGRTTEPSGCRCPTARPVPTVGGAWHWPDEEAERRLKYPQRFGIEPLAKLENIPLGPEGPLTEAGSDAIRRSGTDRGMGKLVQMPAQRLLDLAGIPFDPDEPEDVPLDQSPGFTADQVDGKKKPQRRRRGAGYISDPKKRKTIEKLGKPYDLRCTRGTEERHVEVKGTTGAATSVELTINEVLHARDKGNTVDLYVVSDIRVDTHTDPYTASGGTVSHYTDWEPAEEDLRPRKYEYRLPETTA